MISEGNTSVYPIFNRQSEQTHTLVRSFICADYRAPPPRELPVLISGEKPLDPDVPLFPFVLCETSSLHQMRSLFYFWLPAVKQI